MRVVNFLIFSFLMALFSCRNDAVSNSGTGSNPSGSSPSDNSAKTEPTAKDSDGSSFLTSGIWAIDVVITAEGEDKDAPGKWYQFKDDGSFEYGKYDKLLSTGTWKFDFKELMVKLQYKDLPNEPVEWKILLIGDAMVWKGNTPNNPKGTQIKFSKTQQKPVRKE